MNTETSASLKNLLLKTPDKAIVCAPFLIENGFSHDQLKQYVKSGYLDSVGRGAYCKHGHMPPLAAAINAAVTQLESPLHLGGWSALSHHGLLHFLPLADHKATLYTQPNTRLPAWMEHAYQDQFVCKRTSILPELLAIENEQLNGFAIPISTPERAILEYLHSVPDEHPLNEAYQIMEMMLNARPNLLQELLEKCNSIKVKRLFFLLADDLKPSWYEDLSPNQINLGSGNRVIDEGGRFHSKWLLTVKDWRSV